MHCMSQNYPGILDFVLDFAPTSPGNTALQVIIVFALRYEPVISSVLNSKPRTERNFGELVLPLSAMLNQ